MMYNYAILLMKGLELKRNRTQGFHLLEKAAGMGSINALNGLGWYYGMILKDHKRAVKYYEQAALNGNHDCMFNLGIYHLTGNNPDNPQSNECDHQTAAFHQFLNASRLGHVAASVEAARYLSKGSLEGVSQDVQRAVIMLKAVCEENGHLGFMVREALQAYLQGSWREAFVSYALAAETGLGLAQSNAAHLCEGTYNLAVLTQQGHTLALSVHGLFNVSHDDEEDSVVEKILQRCLQTETEAITPCSLALLGFQMGAALRRMTQNGAQLLLVTSFHPPHLQINTEQRVPSHRVVALRARSSSVSHDGINLNRQQDGIMGGTYSAAGNQWLTLLNSKQWLRQTGDLAVTLSGMCLCAFGTALLYHLL